MDLLTETAVGLLYYGRYYALLLGGQAILGPILIWRCGTGFLSREGKYDRRSTEMMNYSYAFGVIVGILMTLNAVKMYLGQ